MAKSKKPADSEAEPAEGPMDKATLFFPRPLLKTLDYHAKKLGESRSEVIRTFLREKLEEEGYQPDRDLIVEMTFRYE